MSLSETAFTPGPWFAGGLVGDGEQGRSISVGPFDVSDKPSPCHYEDTICEVWDNPNIAEDAAGNARLIAAAPNIFAAAVKLRAAQRAYMAVRSMPPNVRDVVGREVAAAAEELDTVLAAASGMEAGTVETEGLDPKDDSPTASGGDAKPISGRTT